MARPGITYVDVAKTAIKLVEQQINPSIEEIRKTLGTGSNSTINKYLREWRSKYGYQAEIEQGLPETLLVAVRGIYDGIQEEATNKINNIDEESKKAITDLQAKFAVLETEHVKSIQVNKSLESSIQLLQEEKLALQRGLEALQQDLAKNIAENAVLQERLEDKKAEIITLKQQLKNVQDNLEHYRETMKQTRETENNLFNEQITSLVHQLHQQQKLTEKTTTEITTLTKQNTTLREAKEFAVRELNTVLKDLQEQKLTIQSQTATHNNLKEKYHHVLTEQNKLTNELKIAQEVATTLKINLEKAQERISMLDEALKKAENKVVIVSDQNLFLTQEKTELAFQLKQMQAYKR
jgi:chromosome segregation ATPase